MRTSHWLALPFLVSASTAVWPAAARATPPAQPEASVQARGAAIDADRWRGRPWLLHLHLSAGAPSGTLAVEVDRSLARWLSIAGGAGMAASLEPQISTMLRARHVMAATAVGAGLGASYGTYDEAHLPSFLGDHRLRPGSLWASGELFLERRSARGASVRAYAGVSRWLTGEPCTINGETCAASDRAAPDDAWLPYAGLAFGRAF